jgi:hypothetical protein
MKFKIVHNYYENYGLGWQRYVFQEFCSEKAAQKYLDESTKKNLVSRRYVVKVVKNEIST